MLDEKGRARTLLVARSASVLALVAACVGPIFLLSFELLSGFSRESWLLAAALSCLVVFIACLVVARTATARLKAAGFPSPREQSRFAQFSRTWLVLIGTLVLIGSLSAIGIGLSQAIPGWELGAHPSLATASSVQEGQCGRCAVPVYVQFRLRNTEVVATLAGANGTEVGDGPGLQLVYDPNDPSRVMRQRDWQAARDGSSLRTALLGVAGLGGLIGGMALTIARRRRQFGDLRPGLAIDAVSRKRKRRGAAWRTKFADGRRTDYVETDRLRAALIARLSPTALNALDEASRQKLLAGNVHPSPNR